MEGIFFYWIFWCYWIIVTFWMKKETKRMVYAIFILLVIMASLKQVTFSFGTVGLSYLLIGIVFLGRLVLHGYQIYSTFAVVIIAFAYAALQLFYVYDPIWFLDKLIFISSMMTGILALLLGKNTQHCITILVLGQSIGELFFWIVAYRIVHVQVEIGYLAYMETLTVSSLCVGVWFAFKWVTKSLEQFVDKSVKGKGRIL